MLVAGSVIISRRDVEEKAKALDGGPEYTVLGTGEADRSEEEELRTRTSESENEDAEEEERTSTRGA
jgi:hypothetical protein